MPRNGSGTYKLPYNWVEDRDNGIKVLASRMEGQDEDMAEALTGSLAADGQTPWTGNQNANNTKIQNLTDGSAASDSITLGQAQAKGISYFGIATTSNQILFALAPSPALSEYTNGLKFEFEVASACLADPTIKISNLLVSSNPLNLVKSDGAGGIANLVANDLLPNRIYNAGYYTDIGTTKIFVFNPEIQHINAGNVIVNNKFSFSSASTLTISSGIVTITKSNHLIDGEASAADNLDTINGGINGMELNLQIVNSARPITITQAGNILTQNGNSLLINSTTSQVKLIYRASDSKWIISSTLIKQYNANLAITQTFTVGGSLTIAHGLGQRPDMIRVYLKCLSASAGYSVGQIISTDTSDATGPSIITNGLQIVPDATNLNIRMSDSGYRIIDFSSGAAVDLDMTKFSLIFTATVFN